MLNYVIYLLVLLALLKKHSFIFYAAAAAAVGKSLQSCPTLCNPIDSSPPGSSVPGILQARTLEWVTISFSNAWKWKWSRSVVSDSLWPHGLQPTRLLRPWDPPGKSTWVGCHCLLHTSILANDFSLSPCGYSWPHCLSYLLRGGDLRDRHMSQAI